MHDRALIAGGSIEAARAIAQRRGRPRGELLRRPAPRDGRPRRRASASTTTRAGHHRLLDAGVERVAYVDVDVHHGDGVQAAFYDDPRVLTISMHESPLSLFPGTGWPRELGGGEARGQRGQRRAAGRHRRRRLAAGLPRGGAALLAAFRPEVLVTQHGADTHREDPLADLMLTVDGQRAAYLALRDLAETARRPLAGAGRRRLLAGPGRAAGLDPPAGDRRSTGDSTRRRRRARGLDRAAAAPARPAIRCPSTCPTASPRRPAGSRGTGRPTRVDRAILATSRRGLPAARPRPARSRATDRGDIAGRAPATARAAGPGYPQHWEADVVSPTAASPTCGRSARRRRGDPRDARRMLRADAVPAVLLRRPDDLRRAPGAVHRRRPRRPRWRLSPSWAARSSPPAGTTGSRARTATRAAEVAFVVEDAQQRRGLGSILLEHLAAAAQERGIRRFTAEVLAENRTMVRVFIDAGYAVSREYASGVLDLEFDIEPTEKSRAVRASREQRAEAASIARLLHPAVGRGDRRVRRRRPSSATRCW